MKAFARIWRFFFGARARASLLRELVSEELWREDPACALLDAAVFLRRAGLEHLVCDPSRSEVLALAHAGEVLQDELVRKLRDPAKGVVERSDGGQIHRTEVLREALAESRGRR